MIRKFGLGLAVVLFLVRALTGSDQKESAPINKDVEKSLNEGMEALRKKDFDKAIESFTAALRLDPKNGGALQGLAAALVDKNDFDGAIALYTKLIQLEPGGPRGYLGRALIHGVMEQYEEAVADCDQVIRIRNDLSLAFTLRALARVKLLEKTPPKATFTDPEKVLADLDEAIRLEGSNVTAYILRARLLYAQAQYKAAIRDYNAAMGLLSRQDGASSQNSLQNSQHTIMDRWVPNKERHILLFRGDSFLQLGECDQAVSDFAKMIRMDPKDVIGHLCLAHAQEYSKDYAKARIAYDEGVRTNPENAVAFMGLAQFLVMCPDDQQRDAPRAVECAYRACQLDEWRSRNCLALLAAAYAENGQFDLAIGWQKKALEMAKEDDKSDYRARLELYVAGKPYRQAEEKKNADQRNEK